MSPRIAAVPGLLICAAAALLAVLAHAVLPLVPAMTFAVLGGAVAANIPAARPSLDGALKAGIATASRRLLRVGIVLLGLKLSLGILADLGVPVLLVVVFIVLSTFGVTLGLARAVRIPGRQPLLLAAGFAICGVSAIGAMATVTHAKEEEVPVPVAVVTVYGTLAIVVLPSVSALLGLSAAPFGEWVGLSVQDVGQVVATAQFGGTGALAVATAVKLSRVLLLAPMTAIVAVTGRHEVDSSAGTKRPPLVPLFIVGFAVAVLLRSLVPIPDPLLAVADAVQSFLLSMALFGIGTSIRLGVLRAAGRRAAFVGLGSWIYLAGVALAAVYLLPR